MSWANESVIIIEFNELTPSLMSKFMAMGALPNFQKFHGQSHVYVTDAAEEGELLNPWVQWVTIHSGLSAAEHGITRLSDGYKLKTKSIWDLLSDAGLRVWICGSMNPRFSRTLNGYLLSDPWSTGLGSIPEREFDAYYTFVSWAVQEHSKEEVKTAKWEALGFLMFMLRHGLSISTAYSIIAQLMREQEGKHRWKRAIIMDRLQWDLFHYYYNKCKPHFATFFLNSTAHYQHSYWRNMEPEAFVVKPSMEGQEEYKDAILLGYLNMDKLLGRFITLAGQSTTLIFCTALSQQPYLMQEASGGRHYYRIRSSQVFKDLLCVPSKYAYKPVMAEQCLLSFLEEVSAVAGEQILSNYRLDGRPAFHLSRVGSEIMVQCNYTHELRDDLVLTMEGSSRSIPFSDVFYSMDVLKSGFHHPDGMLWIRYPSREHRIHHEKVSLLSIAPGVLEIFDVPPPPFMTSPPFTKSC